RPRPPQGDRRPVRSPGHASRGPARPAPPRASSRGSRAPRCAAPRPRQRSRLAVARPGRPPPHAPRDGAPRPYPPSRLPPRRRRKVDVLRDLPPKTNVAVDLELAGEQRRTYGRAESEGSVRLRALGRDVRVAHIFELITRLKQICNVCPVSGQSAKLDDLESRLSSLEAQGHRALVFSQYAGADGLAAIEDRTARWRPLVYSGAMSLED